MPAAAVIPAPLAYIKVAAVKKLVVGSRDRISSAFVGPCLERGRGSAALAGSHPEGLWLCAGASPFAMARRRVWASGLNWMPAFERGHFTLNKSECSTQAPPRSYGSAWNNGRGPASASIGLTEAGNDQEERMGAEVWLGER